MMELVEQNWNARELLDARVLQHNERACSVACLTMVVNAARVLHSPNEPPFPFTPLEVLERTANEKWLSAVAAGGHGVTLAELADLAPHCLQACEISSAEVALEYVASNSQESLDRVRRALRARAENPARFLIVNFLHSVYTGDPTGDEGHFSVVAGYDPVQQRVLVLDPDLDDYQPYWVSEQQFLEGMATQDSASGRSRGFLTIRIPSPRASSGRKPIPR